MSVSKLHRYSSNARLITSLAGVNFWQFWVYSQPCGAELRPGGALRNAESLTFPSSRGTRMAAFYRNDFRIQIEACGSAVRGSNQVIVRRRTNLS